MFEIRSFDLIRRLPRSLEKAEGGCAGAAREWYAVHSRASLVRSSWDREGEIQD